MEKRVLVVEDSDANRELLKDLLEKVFLCRVETAVDGADAVRKAGELKPDLILMDLGLPKMDGTEAARIIREDPEIPAVPCFALTGYTGEGEERRILSQGFDGYLPKPFDVPKLLKVLSDHIPPRSGIGNF